MDYKGLSEQEVLRRKALLRLKELGIEAYPAAEYPVNIYTTEIIEQFKDDFLPENLKNICIAGRLMLRRIMGNASFVELQDSKGRIQSVSYTHLTLPTKRIV